ncbi:MAG: transposase, partial [Verrucomicrobia bacterium]|nr:transposase [Verrucomicrobiota bacterium]
NLCNKDFPKIIFEHLCDQKENFESVASVVMPNHIPFVMRLKNGELRMAMKSCKGKTAIGINRILNKTGPVWQRGYFDNKFSGDEELPAI